MGSYNTFSTALLLLLTRAGVECGGTPNIVVIVADDLGWNDVSWNNKAMTTPTLERLASEGIRLNQAYSQQVLQIDQARPTHQETKMSL